MKTVRYLPLFVLILGILSVALGGCSQSLTAPDAVPSPALAASAGGTNAIPDIPGWTRIAEDNIPVGRETILSGSRYSVRFTKAFTRHAIKAAMFERSSDLFDVTLEPDGIRFDGDVFLTIDYAGTVYDPDSPDYSGAVPRAGKYDTAAAAWRAYPGAVNDPVGRTITLPLSGFSRYGLIEDGAGGSTHGPREEVAEGGVN